MRSRLSAIGVTMILRDRMSGLRWATGLFALGILVCSVVPVRAQEAPSFSYDVCVKARDGKLAEYSAYLQDVVAKVGEVRVNSGNLSSFVIAQAFAPQGTSARCDFHIVYGYAGFPRERTAEDSRADYKKAGIPMTREQARAKRNELAYGVGMDIWRGWESVGTMVKGGYARLNYYKTKPGKSVAEWVKSSASGWKGLAEEFAKTPGFGWGAFTLAMPGGSSLPYDCMTVDTFPSWEALGKGVPTLETWKKVHPDMDFFVFMEHRDSLIERPEIDYVRLIEVKLAK